MKRSKNKTTNVNPNPLNTVDSKPQQHQETKQFKILR
jgi:hypothetical protein